MSPKIVKTIAVLAVCSFLVILNPRNFFSPFRQVFFALIYPFQKTAYIFSRKTGDLLIFLGSISELREENEKLLRENNAFAAKSAEVESTKKENEELREQLKLLPREKFDLESGFVIGQDPQSLGSWIMIDKGDTTGVKKGMPVIVSSGILIGRVEDVFLSSSRVNLLTSPTSSVNVEDTETSARGVIRGAFGLGLVMDMVSQTEVLKEDDQIVTSGLGGSVPKGLLIGKIEKIMSSGDGLYQQAVVSPRVRYTKLDVVSVIKNTF